MAAGSASSYILASEGGLYDGWRRERNPQRLTVSVSIESAWRTGQEVHVGCTSGTFRVAVTGSVGLPTAPAAVSDGAQGRAMAGDAGGRPRHALPGQTRCEADDGDGGRESRGHEHDLASG